MCKHEVQVLHDSYGRMYTSGQIRQVILGAEMNLSDCSHGSAEHAVRIFAIRQHPEADSQDGSYTLLHQTHRKSEPEPMLGNQKSKIVLSR
jgi:hypothetical protein